MIEATDLNFVVRTRREAMIDAAFDALSHGEHYAYIHDQGGDLVLVDGDIDLGRVVDAVVAVYEGRGK